MTKADFASQFDFTSLLYASDIVVHFVDGTVKRYDVMNYWDTTPLLVDAIECTDATETVRFPILYVPHPSIAHIEILARLDHPNHGGHPESGIVFPTIDEVYAQHQTT